MSLADNQILQILIFYQCQMKMGTLGPYGGRFVSETLISALDDLQLAYSKLKDDAGFQSEFDTDLAHYVGRPSPIYHAERWSKKIGGAQIFLKREDLNHTSSQSQ